MNEDIKQEIKELISSINNCNKWNSDITSGKEFKENTINEFVNFKAAIFTNELYKTFRELGGK